MNEALDENLDRDKSLDNDKSCENDSVDKNVEKSVNNEPDIVDISKVNDNAKKYSLRSRDSIKLPIRYEANLADVYIPQTFEQAIQSDEKDKWNKAISEEVSALAKNETWDVVPLPKDKKAINSRWVFSVKPSENGNSPRFKARLCAKGYTQEKGIDYTDTFSPTVRYDSIRILLAIAVQRKLKIKQFDVKTAFLNGHLREEVYMLPPEGINIESGMVCRLKKALYGLKQASRQWNERFDQFLKSIGFIQSNADRCVYQRTFNNTKIFLTLYVDDDLFMGEDEAEL